MSKFDPRFWEIPVDPQILDGLTAHDNQEEDSQDSPRQIPSDVVDLLHLLIRTRLTKRQQQILELYYFEGLTEQEIAERLEISQQVVSKHLFGALRDGRKVGGAVKKLRKIMSGMNIEPKKWV